MLPDLPAYSQVGVLYEMKHGHGVTPDIVGADLPHHCEGRSIVKANRSAHTAAMTSCSGEGTILALANDEEMRSDLIIVVRSRDLSPCFLQATDQTMR